MESRAEGAAALVMLFHDSPGFPLPLLLLFSYLLNNLSTTSLFFLKTLKTEPIFRISFSIGFMIFRVNFSIGLTSLGKCVIEILEAH
jgi:predicted membrane protein